MSGASRACRSGFFVRLLGAIAVGAALVGAIGGCGGSVTGTWVLDKERTIKSGEAALKEMIAKEAKAGDQSKEDQKVATEFALSMMKGMIEQTSMTIEIRSDKTFKATSSGPGSMDFEGTWAKGKDGYTLTPNDFGAVMTMQREGAGLWFRPADPEAPKFYMKRG